MSDPTAATPQTSQPATPPKTDSRPAPRGFRGYTHRPTSAPATVGPVGRALRWLRSRPAVVALIALAALGTAFAYRLDQARLRAERAEQDAVGQMEIAQQLEIDASGRLRKLQRTAYNLQLQRVGVVHQQHPAQGVALLADEDLCPPELREFTWRLYQRVCQREPLVLKSGGEVAAAVVSPDGRTLAVAGPGGDNRWGGIRLYDLATGEERVTLAGHPEGFMAMAFSPDGRLLASAGFGFEARLWDAVNGKQVASWDKVPAASRVAFSPDGKTLAAVGAQFRDGAPTRKGEARLWETMTGKETGSHTIGADHVAAAAFEPDGKGLVVVGKEGVSRIDVVSGEEKVLRGMDGGAWPIEAVALRPDGKAFALSRRSGLSAVVEVWEVGATKQSASLLAADRQASVLVYSPDGRLLAAGGGEPKTGTGRVRVWGPDYREVATLAGQGSQLTAAALALDGQTLITGTADQAVKAWNLGQEAADLEPMPTLARAIAVRPDGKLAAVGNIQLAQGANTVRGELRLIDPRTGARKGTLSGAWGSVAAVAFSPDGSRLAAATDSMARVWDGEGKKLLLELVEPRKIEQTVISCLAWSPDGKELFTGGWDGKVIRWDAATGEQRGVVREGKGNVVALAVSPDGTTLATSCVPIGKDGKLGSPELKLWNPTTGAEKATLPAGEALVACMAFSPDSKTLAWGTGSAFDFDHPGVVHVWDVEAGRERAVLSGHRGTVASLTFSGDGRTLASAGAETTRGEIKLWDPVSGQERATLRGHAASVFAVAFLPDGTALFSGGGTTDKGEVKRWDAPESRP